MGWRNKKAAIAATINPKEARLSIPPPNSPINNGLSRKTHEP
jgi:hypothetical protein